jgi:hypothetical protein
MANAVRISVTVDNDTARGLAGVRASIAALQAQASEDIHLDVNADADGVGRAEEQIAELRTEASDDINVDVNVDTDGVRRARSEIASLGRIRLPFLNTRISVEGLATIIPMAAQAAAAILSIGAAAAGAGAALGSIALAALPGLSAIKNALSLHKAALNETTGASRSATGATNALASAKAALADAVRNASRAIFDADEALGDAERELGRTARENAQDIADAKAQVVAAARGVTEAESRLVDANKAATDAQKALNDARKEAADDLASLTDQLTDSSLAQRDATLAVQRAEKDLQATLRDPRADDVQRQQAQLTLDQARQNLKERTEAQDKLKASAAQQAAAGVEGSKKVQDAESRLADAQEAQKQAAQGVVDAQNAVKKAVSDVADAQVKASERMADAQERVADAARNVQRAHEDAASSIASAQRGVQSAMDSAAASAGGAETAQDKYNKALAAMNPATRATYDALLKLGSAFKAWGSSLAPDVMPIFTNGIYILIDLLPKLTPLVKGASKVVGDLVSHFRTKLEHGDFDKIIDKFNSWSVSSLKKIVDYIGILAGHVKNMVVSKNFQDFMDDVNQNGPVMADTLQQLGDFIGKFITAAGPMAGLSFKVLDALATDLNMIPMPVLDILAPTILAIGLAMKAAAIGQALWNIQLAITEGVLDSLGIGEILLLIGLLILAVIEIAKHHEAMLRVIKATWSAISNAIGTAWNWIYRNVISPIGTYFTKTIPGWARTLSGAVVGAWNGLKNGVSSAYRSVKSNAVDPIVRVFSKTIPDAGNKMVSFFKGLPGRITSATRGMFNGIKDAFRAALNWVIDKWNNLSFKIGGQKVFGVSLPSVTISTPNLPHLATGGITGGGLAMVGENGPELVRLPSGSSVMNNGATQRAMASGGTTKVDLTINSSNRPIDRVLLELLRDAIRRYNGGNVQAALGS